MKRRSGRCAKKRRVLTIDKERKGLPLSMVEEESNGPLLFFNRLFVAIHPIFYSSCSDYELKTHDCMSLRKNIYSTTISVNLAQLTHQIPSPASSHNRHFFFLSGSSNDTKESLSLSRRSFFSSTLSWKTKRRKIIT